MLKSIEDDTYPDTLALSFHPQSYLITAFHFRRANMAKEIARLKEEAEMLKQNSTR